MEFEEFCRSLGITDGTQLTPENRAALSAAWRAQFGERTPAGGPGGNVATATAPADPAAVLRSYVERFPDRRQALAEAFESATASGQPLELSLLRATYDNGPQAFSPGGPATSADNLVVAGMAAQFGMSDAGLVRAFGDRVPQMARERGYHRLGLHDLLRMQLDRAGHHCPRGKLGGDDIRQALRLDHSLQASGPSTANTSGILSNVASKLMSDSFQEVPTTWQFFSRPVPANDFKQISLWRLNGDLEYLPIPPGGEVKHGTLGEEDATVQAKLTARLLALDYQHIRNDDLGAFATIPAMLGRRGAVSVDKAAYVALLNSIGSFISAANGNYLDGSSSAVLDATGLAAAEKAFAEQVDSDGVPAYITPKILLVAPEKDNTARVLVANAPMVGGSSLANSFNPFGGKYTPMSSAWLGEAAGLSGSDDDGWFLMAAAGPFAPLVAAFLDGQQAPTIESAETDLSTFGMIFRGSHSFGFGTYEFRGVVYGTGNAGA